MVDKYGWKLYMVELVMGGNGLWVELGKVEMVDSQYFNARKTTLVKCHVTNQTVVKYHADF